MKDEKKQTERERQFMKDKHGLPLNKAIEAKKPKKYGVFAQH